MREYVVDGLPTGKQQFSAFLKRNIANGDVVTADPETADAIPWLKDPAEVAKPAVPPAAESFEGLSSAAAKVVGRLAMTPTEALRLGVAGLLELGVSKTSANAIVKAAAGNG